MCRTVMPGGADAVNAVTWSAQCPTTITTCRTPTAWRASSIHARMARPPTGRSDFCVWSVKGASRRATPAARMTAVTSDSGMSKVRIGEAQCPQYFAPVPLLNRNVTPNCFIGMSPHGDIHDEQEGSAAGGLGQGRPGRTDHQRARSKGAAHNRAAISAGEEALPRAWSPWATTRPPGTPRQPAPDPAGPGADHRAHDPHYRRLQRRPLDREAAGGAWARREPSHGEEPPPSPWATGQAPALCPQAPQPAAPESSPGPTGPARRQSLRLVRGP